MSEKKVKRVRLTNLEKELVRKELKTFNLERYEALIMEAVKKAKKTFGDGD